MNVDTDTQYAFTREIAGHMFTNYDGVLKVDGEVGNKKAYDPRSYLKLAEVRHGRPRVSAPARTCSPPGRPRPPDQASAARIGAAERQIRPPIEVRNR